MFGGFNYRSEVKLYPEDEDHEIILKVGHTSSRNVEDRAVDGLLKDLNAAGYEEARVRLRGYVPGDRHTESHLLDVTKDYTIRVPKRFPNQYFKEYRTLDAKYIINKWFKDRGGVVVQDNTWHEY